MAYLPTQGVIFAHPRWHICPPMGHIYPPNEYSWGWRCFFRSLLRGWNRLKNGLDYCLGHAEYGWLKIFWKFQCLMVTLTQSLEISNILKHLRLRWNLHIICISKCWVDWCRLERRHTPCCLATTSQTFKNLVLESYLGLKQNLNTSGVSVRWVGWYSLPWRHFYCCLATKSQCLTPNFKIVKIFETSLFELKLIHVICFDVLRQLVQVSATSHSLLPSNDESKFDSKF